MARGGAKYRGKYLEVEVNLNEYDAGEIDKAFEEIGKAVDNNVLSINEGLVEMRNQISQDIKMRIQNKIWENRSIVTGRLWGSIAVDPDYLDPKNEISIYTPQDIGTNVFYAPYVEERKPFMQPVWDEVKDTLIRRLQEEVGRELA